MHYDEETLDDYLHGELEDERDAAIHEHLEGCNDCRKLYNEITAVRDALRASPLAVEREMPPTIKAQVWETIRNAPPSPLERVRMLWRPVLLVPLAAVMALVVYFAPPLRTGAQPAVTAAYLLEEHAAGTAVNPLADRGLIVPASTATGELATNGLIVDAADVGAGR